jgi:hypothetical protein
MVILRHRYEIEQVVNLLKGAATAGVGRGDVGADLVAHAGQPVFLVTLQAWRKSNPVEPSSIARSIAGPRIRTPTLYLIHPSSKPVL